MARYANMKRTLLEPLEPDVKKGLDELIAEAKPYAEQYRKNVWQLILILKRVETSYGDRVIFRWSEAIGVHWRDAYRWRQIAKTITPEFVKKYGDKLNIAKALVLSQYYAFDDIPQEVIDYAINPKTTAMSLQGYLNQINSVSQEEIEQLKEEARYRVGEFAERVKLDEIERNEFEQLADSNPDLARRLTEELGDAEAYREWNQQHDRKTQARLENYVQRKAEPMLQRMLNNLESNADDMKEAIKKEADTRKFRRLLDDIMNILQELDAITPEDLPQEVKDEAIPIELKETESKSEAQVVPLPTKRAARSASRPKA